MKPTRKLNRWLGCNHVIREWTDASGKPEYRVGRLHRNHYIEKIFVHYAGLAGLTVRRTATKQEALAFTPSQWIDPI